MLAILVLAIINLNYQLRQGECWYVPVLLVLISIVLPVIAFKARGFALRAQDRAIRAEENLRHFAMTGKLLHPSLTMKQIIALRFAPDEEFVSLSKEAVEKKLSASEIKRSIINWRPDHHRV